MHLYLFTHLCVPISPWFPYAEFKLNKWSTGTLFMWGEKKKKTEKRKRKKPSQLPQGSLSLLLHPGLALVLPNILWTSRITFASAQRIRCCLLLCTLLNKKTPSFTPDLSCSEPLNVRVMLRKPTCMTWTFPLLDPSSEEGESHFVRPVEKGHEKRMRFCL